ncbi:MAG: SurA N-terminal domain-containing protein [Prevotella sp.]|nr:SurA N-terminal domain-containing protein [Prevotella sp.]
MAAIGKIRSWGPLLVGVIGLALFAFIAEELFRSCDSMKNQERQQIGEVLGKKIDYQEYQKLFDEYQDVIKMTQGTDNLTDEQSNQVKDMVWNQYVQTVLIADEAEKLGLTVTDDEMMNILKQGTNPVLMNTPFVNEKTGRFDIALLQRFRNEYKTASQQGQVADQYRSINNYWSFIEKNLRQQTLAQKYQALLGACFLSNPVSAKAAFQAENEESNIELASIAYTTIKDDQVKVSDADLKAKYDEQKIRFHQLNETRDIKFVTLKVQASQTDRAKIDADIKTFTAQLTEAADPTEVIRKSGSVINYIGIPQTKAAFPIDIASKLDSMAVGSTSAPVVNSNDNTINVIKLIAKQQLPDSVEFRAITVAGADIAAVRKSADSIYTALQGGADFEAVAKNYGQTGAKNWITSAQYQTSSSSDKDTRAYIEALNTSDVNALKNLQLSNANLVLQVTARRAMTDKYTAAVIKKPITFSNETYNAAYNKFSQYVSENQTLEGLEKNAKKYGYTVEELSNVQNNAHYINNIHGTRDALKWLFEAKAGDVSPLYECGENDQLLVLACKNINEKGYLPYTNEQVNSYLKTEVIKDKKAEQIMAKLKGVNSLDAARKQGAIVTDVPQVTFAAPVYVQSTGASEPALCGAVAATKAGAFSKSPVKGNGGVYLFSVKSRNMREGAKFDEKAQEKQLQQRSAQRAMQMSMQQLYENAEIVDNRYLFF